LVTGCTTLGPNFHRPETPLQDRWLDSGEPRVLEGAEERLWWTVFKDPVLNRLIALAYSQNIPLRAAGARIYQARARLGIAIGEQYPQVQQALGDFAYSRSSDRGPGAPQRGGGDFDALIAQAGVAASWEIDFWGRYRRTIESEEAALHASIAAYDTALVSLTAEVAGSYIQIRTLEERLRFAHDNVTIQTESLNIAEARFRGGATSERDVQQAQTQLSATESTIPQLEASLRRAKNALCILLGVPPRQLGDLLGDRSEIPQAPLEVAVGIPAELLRRRPDIRSAELQAAAQCARIGVARTDLYPAFTLQGTFGFLASDVGRFSVTDIASWGSRYGSFGPGFTWNILNYGRLTNNVRLQDAFFQELIFNYQDTVLRAQQEVEDGLAGFLQSQLALVKLEQAAEAARRSAELALIQYREGVTDYTTVITAQQALLSQQENLAVGQGSVPLNLVSVYRALGGGWGLREGRPFLPPEVTAAMAERTDWGRLLQPAALKPPEPNRLQTPDW
jgi:NodT family efflux transporter outer membrane factor (OMF) lipoprotein